MTTTTIKTNNIDGNGRKKLLIIGKTGTGKSTLCNVITGNAPDADVFAVSAAAESCTQSTQFAEAFFANDPAYPMSVIDTIGFDDPSQNRDAKIIAELVTKLKGSCDHVNLFVIAVNGQNPRLDGSLIGMIRIFEGMFGKEFWKQAVVVFTRMPMDLKAKNKRFKNTKQTDDELARKYMKVVEQQFKEGAGLQYLFLDACFDNDDDDERVSFGEAIKSLRDSLFRAPNLPTSKVKQFETEHDALKRAIAEKEEENRKIEEENARQRKEQERENAKQRKKQEEENDRQRRQHKKDMLEKEEENARQRWEHESRMLEMMEQNRIKDEENARQRREQEEENTRQRKEREEENRRQRSEQEEENTRQRRKLEEEYDRQRKADEERRQHTSANPVEEIVETLVKVVAAPILAPIKLIEAAAAAFKK